MPGDKQKSPNTSQYFILEKVSADASDWPIKADKKHTVGERSSENLLKGATKTDYAVHDLSQHIAAVSTLGKKYVSPVLIDTYQEDRFVIDTVPAMLKQPLVDNEIKQTSLIKKILQNTINELQTQCGQAAKMGATALIAIQYQHKVVAANLGDCSLYHCHIDDAEIFTLARINQWHSPTHPGEKERLENLGARILPDGRLLPYHLNLSRSIGDRDTEAHGLIHDPDLHTYDIAAGGKSFLILASDGLSDYIAIKKAGEVIRGEKALHIALEYYFTKYKQEINEYTIANYLVAVTEQARTLLKNPLIYDNITVIVSGINTTSEPAKLMAIFDGHGGDKVAEACRQNLLSIIDKQIPLCAANLELDNEDHKEEDLPSTLSVSHSPPLSPSDSDPFCDPDAENSPPLNDPPEEKQCTQSSSSNSNPLVKEEPHSSKASSSDSYLSANMQKIIQAPKSSDNKRKRNPDDGKLENMPALKEEGPTIKRTKSSFDNSSARLSLTKKKPPLKRTQSNFGNNPLRSRPTY